VRGNDLQISEQTNDGNGESKEENNETRMNSLTLWMNKKSNAWAEKRRREPSEVEAENGHSQLFKS